MRRFLFIMSLTLILVACGGGQTAPTSAPEPTNPPQQAAQPQEPAQPTNTPQPTDTLAPTDTPAPTGTPQPTDTPQPTITPTPMRTEPEVLLELDGQGKAVTDNYELPACHKAVFYWTATTGEYGAASLIARLHKTDSEGDIVIVNEFNTDVGSDSITWPALLPLEGGEYYFSTENTDEPWSLRVECQDGMASVAEGLDVQGVGLAVTDNYKLSSCQKSVFMWTVEPNESGAASIIARLHTDGGEEAFVFANEFDMDLSEPLEGEKLQSINEGIYYVSVENTSEPWHIRWECRD